MRASYPSKKFCIPPPQPPRLLGAAAEIMEAASQRRIRPPSPEPPRRYGRVPDAFHADFGREVNQMMNKARQQYDASLQAKVFRSDDKFK